MKKQTVTHEIATRDDLMAVLRDAAGGLLTLRRALAGSLSCPGRGRRERNRAAPAPGPLMGPMEKPMKSHWDSLWRRPWDGRDATLTDATVVYGHRCTWYSRHTPGVGHEAVTRRDADGAYVMSAGGWTYFRDDDGRILEQHRRWRPGDTLDPRCCGLHG